MPIVMAGKPFNAWDLKQVAGDAAHRLREAVQTCGELQTQLNTWTDADLLDLGLTQAEIEAHKGFYLGDLPAIQTAMADSTWIKQLLGLGVYGFPTTVFPTPPVTRTLAAPAAAAVPVTDRRDAR